ncbi:MAG: pitrilysin family protein [Myxococcota bacterium]
MATADGLRPSDLPTTSLTLDNGMRVRLIPLPHLQSATVSCFVRVGSRYETEATNGLSHFLEHMLYRGTERHPRAHDLSLAIERLGGTLDAATHVDFTSYDLTLPSESIVEGTALLADVLRNPLLEELTTEKEIIREEILEELNEQGEQIDIDNVSRRLLYPQHPLGFSIAGPLDNLESFGTKHLKDHHRAHYGAENAVLCVAGAFEMDAIESVVRDEFGSFPRQSRAPASVRPTEEAASRFGYVHEPGSQTEVRLSYHTPGLESADAPAFLVLDRILDDGLSTRVHRVLCEERGLAYEAFSGHDTFEDCGIYDFGASVEHGKVPALVQTSLELLRELRADGPNDDEITKAKRRFLWDLRTVRDDPEDTAHFVGTSALFNLPEALSRVADHVASVTADDVRRIASRYLGEEHAYLTCVGVLDEKTRESLERTVSA